MPARLRPKKRQRNRRDVSQSSDPVGNEPVKQQSRQWQAWRVSAQKVTRTWNEWLAADGRQRAASYSLLHLCPTEEERAAAEIERIVKLGAEASACTGSTPHTDEASSARGEDPEWRDVSGRDRVRGSVCQASTVVEPLVPVGRERRRLRLVVPCSRVGQREGLSVLIL
jgi:hypothetical protein